MSAAAVPVLAVQALRPDLDLTALVHRVAAREGTEAAARYAQALLRHQRSVNLAALERALRAGNVRQVARVLGVSQLQQAAGRTWVQGVQSAATSAGRAGAAALEAHGVAMRFDAVNPETVAYARARAGELVAAIPKETRRIVSEVVAWGAAHGVTVVDQARAIREVVGLPPAWAQAPREFADELRRGAESAATARRLSAADKQAIRHRLREGTVTEAWVAEMREKYAASLVNARALRIARTETLRAAHHGVEQGWRQAMAQGALPASTRKVWIVTPDERLSPEHARIPGMNPKGRKLDEPFVTTEGLHMTPPSRPNCRCSMGLVFGGRIPTDASRAATAGISRGGAASGRRAAVRRTPARRAAAGPLRGERAEAAMLTPRVNAAERQAMRYASTDLGSGAMRQALSPRTADPISAPYYTARELTKAREAAALVQGVMERTPGLKREIEVWRGFLTGGWTPRKGMTFTDKMFTSTTTRRTVAERFPVWGAADESGDLVLARIRVPKGQQGLWMRPTSTFKHEHEFLLPQNTKFRVRGARRLTREEFIEEFGPTNLNPNGRARIRVLDIDVVPQRKTRRLRVSADRPAPGGVQVARRTTVTARELEAVTETLTEMGVDPRAVTFDGRLLRATVGRAEEGGFTGTVVGEYHKGKIRLAPGRPLRQLRQTAAHEAQHLKFDLAVHQTGSSLEAAAFRRRLWAEREALAAEDGVTAYSRAHWRQARMQLETAAGHDAFFVALDETLAEMRAMQAVGRTVGTPRYQALLRAVDRRYAAASQAGPGVTARGGRRLAVRREAAEGTAAKRATGPYRLPEEEFNALRGYTYSSAGNINRFLRGQALSDNTAEMRRRLKAFSKLLDRAFTRVPKLSRDIIVWRGAGARFVPKVGKAFRDAGYVSTSYGSAAAERFARQSARGGTVHLMRVRVPKGQRALPVREAGRQSEFHPDEEEVLLPRGWRYRAVSRRTLSLDGYYRQYGETGNFAPGTRVVITDVEVVR